MKRTALIILSVLLLLVGVMTSAASAGPVYCLGGPGEVSIMCGGGGGDPPPPPEPVCDELGNCIFP